MRSILSLLVLSTLLSGCGKKSEPLPPPTAEAIAVFTEAAFNGNTLAVTIALKNGMPVDQKEENGNSGLMLASFNGHVETMQALLDAGAEVNLRDGNDRNALMFAASGPFPAAVRLLLENGAEINVIDNGEHFTARHRRQLRPPARIHRPSRQAPGPHRRTIKRRIAGAPTNSPMPVHTNLGSSKIFREARTPQITSPHRPRYRKRDVNRRRTPIRHAGARPRLRSRLHHLRMG